MRQIDLDEHGTTPDVPLSWAELGALPAPHRARRDFPGWRLRRRGPHGVYRSRIISMTLLRHLELPTIRPLRPGLPLSC